MYKRPLLLLFFFAVSCGLRAQMLPAEGSKLNYRLIGFSFPAIKEKATECRVELAIGIYNNEDSFKKNICTVIPCQGNKVIGLAPFWAEAYTWRMIYTGTRVTKVKSGLHHFSIDSIPEIDTAHVRLRIVRQAEKYKDAYVLLDGNKAMYDMEGNPVWFLPDEICGKAYPTNLSISPQGTITLLHAAAAYEINYNGDILWKAQNDLEVSGTPKSGFHHDFIRLANGHYMVLGSEIVPWRPRSSAIKNKKPQKKNSPPNPATDKFNPKLIFGTVVEFDEKGKIVWYWRSSNYFLGSDINYCKPDSNPSDPHYGDIADTHANAFCFDEKGKNLYVGFKNVNRILKIKYPSGTVTNAYGPVYKSGVPQGDTFFCGQHGIGLSKKEGYLYIFDNHFCDTITTSRVMVLKEPGKGKTELKKIWEYPFTYDGTLPLKNVKGGNVMELADSSLFVCMGMQYSKMFIVNMDKEILWSAVPEKWNEDDKKWNVIPQYRASIIENRQALEKLVWNAEKLLPASLSKASSRH